MSNRPLAVTLLSLLACCATERSTEPTHEANAAGGPGEGPGEVAAAAADVELLAVADLPRASDTEGLSGTWFDTANDVMYALQDSTASIVPLVPSADLGAWKPGAPITLSGRPDSDWDGEGLARSGDTFFALTIETKPLLERFDGAGKYLGAVELPAHFAQQAPGNKGIESLSLAPSGKFLFAANEAALTTDGAVATKTRGTMVRILRRDLASGADEERAYLTEPLGPGTGGDMGVSDVTALDDDTVLVLERGFQADYGNTVRIFVAELSSAPDVSGARALDASTPILAKKLVVDLGTLSAEGVTHPGVQANPILDNYEALAIGQSLPDGRRVVFVTSDDNASKTQVPRVLALALRL